MEKKEDKAVKDKQKDKKEKDNKAVKEKEKDQ